MIDRIIAALGSKSVGLELTSKEIADVLWLAVQMQRKSAPSSVQVQSIQPTLPETPVIPSQSNNNIDSQKPSNSEEKSTNIYPQSPTTNSYDSTESSGLPIKVPSPQALRNELALARSLKPLKRRVPSRTTEAIDEGATAQRIAEEKLWIPVMRPAPERWLEVALVIDESPSMMLWKQTIKELRQLLERHGAFRDVRTWGLSIDTNEKVLLRPSGSAQKRFHSPKELIEPNGRRLFLVISDCVSSAWRSGAITRALSVWANTSPMAILQVLPEWLWERSALGIAESVLLRSLAPGVPNQQLITKALDLLDDVTNSLKIPVVSLEPQSLKTWARMVAGAGDVQSKGFLFALDSLLDNNFVSAENYSTPLSAKQRLQRFRLSASPMARKLAGLMAAAPVSLPVVRLIQQTMLPQSSQVHVAEVFLGGILKPLSDINVDIELDNVQYEFFDGVRDLLLDSIPISLSAEVVGNISDYIAKRAGLSVNEFTAMLVNPTAYDIWSDVLIRPFAKVTAKVLRRFGERYTQLAEELEKFSQIAYQNYTSFKQSKILCVDDTSDNLVLLETILEVEGYNIELIQDSVIALKMVEDSPPDLLVLDVMMPELDGYEFTRRIRQNSSLPYIPILLLTAFNDASVVEGLDAGADDFIRKPFDQDELFARVRSLLRIKHIIYTNMLDHTSLTKSVGELLNKFSYSQLSERNRIFCVDDTNDNLLLLETILELEGYNIKLIQNSAIALNMVEDLPPDLLILDVMMPELNGYEFTRRVRQNKSLPYIPILLVTAFNDASVVEGLDAGADDFIRKPFDNDEFLARVRSLLRLKILLSKEIVLT
jgi:DNA-binding response OmpR family regulator